MTYYNDLGIQPDASDADIKQAYRAKAQQHHPDKGGDAEEFARIAEAYETLKNPERKRLYDATGRTRETSFDDEVQNTLRNLFEQVLLAEPDIDVLDCVNSRINSVIAQMSDQLTKLKGRHKKLLDRRKRIKSKGPMNIAHQVIDAALLPLSHEITSVDYTIKVGKECLKILKSYSEKKVDRPERPTHFGVSFGRSEGISFWPQ